MRRGKLHTILAVTSWVSWKIFLDTTSFEPFINESNKTFFFADRTLGNSGGMGGIFGPLYAVGKGFPFPEAKPFSPSWQFRTFSFVGQMAGKIAKLTGKK